MRKSRWTIVRTVRVLAIGLLAAVGIAGLLMLLDVASIHVGATNSDGATVVLAASSVANGHVMLPHWGLTWASYWTIDVVFYTFGVLAVGISPALMNFIPALIAALVILVGMWLAYEARPGKAGICGAVTVFALLAFPSHSLSFYFLHGPLHVGTALWCLLAFLALRQGRFSGSWLVGVLILTAGLLGDLQTLALGVVPVFAAGLVTMLRCRDWRSGIPHAAAAVSAVALAALGRGIAEMIGTFTIAGSLPIASLNQMELNLRNVVNFGWALEGVRTGGWGSTGVPLGLRDLHVVGLALCGAAILFFLFDLVRGVINGRTGTAEAGGVWRLDDLLLFALAGDLATFVALAYENNPNFARYLTAGVIFGAILAGRFVSRAWQLLPTGRVRLGATLAGIGLVAVFAAGMGFQLRSPAPAQPAVRLGRFLAAHDLRVGVGAYWCASIVTVETKGVVAVRPVVVASNGRLVTWGQNSSTTWYSGRPFSFIVYNLAAPWGGVDRASAVATFGPIARVFDVGSYQVLVWAHPVGLVDSRR